MSEEMIPVVGGPLDGQAYKWTTAQTLLIPDSEDMVTGYDPKRNELFTLFGEHTYEMKCYAKGDEKRYQLEYAGYRKPTLPAGAIKWVPEPPEVTP